MSRLAELYLRYTFELVGQAPFDHLHWGLFDAVPRAPDELGRAQRRYAERVLELVPGGARRVLDVGAGLGGLARMLADTGKEVLAIGPREDHCRLLAEQRYPGIEVRCSTLQALPVAQPFDLLLFAESFNFFIEQQAVAAVPPSVRAFEALCAPHLQSGGWLLIADLLSEPVHAALCASDVFEVVEDHDVHEAAAYTATALQARLERYAMPYQRLLLDVLDEQAPELARSVRSTLAAVPNQALRALLQGHMVELDQAGSQRYRMLLLRRR